MKRVEMWKRGWKEREDDGNLFPVHFNKNYLLPENGSYFRFCDTESVQYTMVYDSSSCKLLIPTLYLTKEKMSDTEYCQNREREMIRKK